MLAICENFNKRPQEQQEQGLCDFNDCDFNYEGVCTIPEKEYINYLKNS